MTFSNDSVPASSVQTMMQNLSRPKISLVSMCVAAWPASPAVAHNVATVTYGALDVLHVIHHQKI